MRKHTGIAITSAFIAALVLSCSSEEVAPSMDTTGDVSSAGLDTSASSQDTTTTAPEDSGPAEVHDAGGAVAPAAVTRLATYEVEITEDIVYAQGLVHSSWKWDNPEVRDLTLDLYVPKGGATDGKPAIVLIHGGGFVQGNSKQGVFRGMAEYFASRGWVAVSINYRLASHYGLTPTAWLALPPQGGLSQEQHNATYSGARDAKAALRWLHAHAETYGIHPDHVTVGGGSAGAMLSVALGISNPADFRDELSQTADPTLASTHPTASAKVATIVDFWGADWLLDSLQGLDGEDRFDASDPPLLIFHGLEDEAVVYASAEELVTKYTTTGVPYALYPLDAGHSAWTVKVEGQSLVSLAFDFITATQGLVVVD